MPIAASHDYAEVCLDVKNRNCNILFTFPVTRLKTFSRKSHLMMHDKPRIQAAVCLVLLSLCASPSMNAADERAAESQPASTTDLLRELSDLKKQMNELRLIVLDQKKQLDSLRSQAPDSSASVRVSESPTISGRGGPLVASAVAVASR